MPPNSYRRTRSVAALLLIAALGACTSGGSSPATPKLAFVATVDPVSQTDSEPKALTDEGNKIVQMFTEWYQQAFIDPKGWKDPEFPAVTKNFTSGARDQVRKEINSMTIGEARTELSRVTPGPSRINVTVYADNEGKTRHAVADVIFRATGAMKKKGPALQIVQRGTYFLSRESGDWKIWSYRSRVDEAQPSPAPTASPKKS